MSANGIKTSLTAAALGTGQGLASLTEAAGKSIEVAGKTTAKAVQVTGVVADKSLNVAQKGVEVGANVAMAGLNAAGTVSKAGLQTAAVASQAAAQITQAAAKSTANASEATLKASADIVKSGVASTAKIANAALAGTTQVTTDTLKESADAASAAAKFAVGTVTSAIKGANRLKDLAAGSADQWAKKVEERRAQDSKLAGMRTPQIVLDILVKDFEKVAGDLRSSFKDSISASDVSLKLLSVTIKDLYCMSVYRRMTKNTCPTNSQLRKNLEKKIIGQGKELDGKSAFFFKMFDQKLAQTVGLFRAEANKPPPPNKTEEEQTNQIKALFTQKLDEFSTFVAGQLKTITGLFETRTAQYQKIIDKAYEGVFTTNGVFNATVAPVVLQTAPAANVPPVEQGNTKALNGSPISTPVITQNSTPQTAPAAGGRRKKTRKHKKRTKKTRRH